MLRKTYTLLNILAPVSEHSAPRIVVPNIHNMDFVLIFIECRTADSSNDLVFAVGAEKSCAHMILSIVWALGCVIQNPKIMCIQWNRHEHNC